MCQAQKQQILSVAKVASRPTISAFAPMDPPHARPPKMFQHLVSLEQGMVPEMLRLRSIVVEEVLVALMSEVSRLTFQGRYSIGLPASLSQCLSAYFL